MGSAVLLSGLAQSRGESPDDVTATKLVLVTQNLPCLWLENKIARAVISETSEDYVALNTELAVCIASKH